MFNATAFIHDLIKLYVCVCVTCVCVCVCTFECSAFKVALAHSPCLEFPIFDSSKGCLGHGVIGMLSDFLFVMIPRNNKSEITFFVQSE